MVCAASPGRCDLAARAGSLTKTVPTQFGKDGAKITIELAP